MKDSNIAGRTSAMSTLMRTRELTDALSHKSVIEKQKSSIEKLRHQNAKLKEDLLLENKFSVRPSNPGATVLINKLQDEADLFTRKIQLEKRKVLLLEQQLEKMVGTLGTSRATMGGINHAKEKQQEAAKAIKLLENRLEQQYIKYNEAVTCNKGLREQIDNLRRERMMFEAINAALDKDLSRIKRAMADTIAAANDAHAAKERAQAETANLKLQAEKEHAAFEEEWRQLTHIIEEDKRQRDLQRANEMAERERRTQELLRSSEAGVVAKKQKARSNWHIGMNRALAQNVSQEKVRLYQEAFDRIQAATGIQDIDELVTAFVDGEDTNFTLFNYVNEVNAEVEKLEDNITAVRKEIEAYSSKSAAVDDAAAAQAGGTMGRLLTSEAKASAYERRLQNALSMVNTLRSGITVLFDSIGCNTAPVQALLGGEGMSPDNMLAYLGIVEQRAKELLQAYALARGARGGIPLHELLLAQPVPPPAVRITIDPPSSIDHPPSAAAAASAAAALAAAAGSGTATTSSLMATSGGMLSATGGLMGHEGEEELDVTPDDVPLSTAALRARVARNLDTMLERSLKVKPVAAAAGVKPKGRTAQAVC